MTTRTLEIRVNQTGDGLAGLSKIGSALTTVGAIAGGAAVVGIATLGAAITGVGIAGLSMNNSMEQATARINAFTKDSAKTAEVLEMVRDRASKTPFEFNEMATAAASLLPSAKQAQTGLEDLIAQAEILAASNPAEGLEGAAFALKEAVSGDFTSIIERFNLPRSMINQLKEEGLPNLEIVSRAMQELGLDMDLVSALANTAQGRWSTLKDTFTNFASTITQPIFNAFSAGLARVNEILTQNEPALTAVASAIANLFSAIITTASPAVDGLSNRLQTWINQITPQVVAGIKNLQGTLTGWVNYIISTVIPAITSMAGGFIENARQAIPGIILVLKELWNFATSSLLPAFHNIFDALDRAAAVFSRASQETGNLSVAVHILKTMIEPTLKIIEGIGLLFQLWAFEAELMEQAAKDIGAVFKWLGDTWDSVWNGMTAGIQVVVNAWKQLVEIVKWAAGSIPQIFTPGSPTPFETGLRGIAEGAREARVGIAELGGAFDSLEKKTGPSAGALKWFNNLLAEKRAGRREQLAAESTAESDMGVAQAVNRLFGSGRISGFGATAGGGAVAATQSDFISTGQAISLILNYNPAVSLASQADVVNALRGAIEELQRERESR